MLMHASLRTRRTFVVGSYTKYKIKWGKREHKEEEGGRDKKKNEKNYITPRLTQSSRSHSGHVYKKKKKERKRRVGKMTRPYDHQKKKQKKNHPKIPDLFALLLVLLYILFLYICF